MASLNKVLLIGNLTRDPELRYTQSGLAICNFSLAINTFYNDKQGQQQKDTCFLRVTVWGKNGENCANVLKKGRPVFVEGRLKSRSWEQDDGQKRTSIEVVADRVQFLGAPPGKGAGPVIDTRPRWRLESAPVAIWRDASGRTDTDEGPEAREPDRLS
ncbi:MAG: single-stranded DNA-binding protein [Candidatus Riflebacteria bacterium]|nr:single-stranded DNA-binding protein [Candidatus Riflebacteria bacterium]